MNKKFLGDDPLSLTNDGYLSLFFVGCGSAFSKVHYQNNLLVIKGNDHLLIDCGTVCPTAIFNYKNNIMNIRNFLITHSHADHIGGLEEAALLSRYVIKNKPNIVLVEEYKDYLWNDSLKGGLAYGERNNGKYLEFDDYFNYIKPQLISTNPRPLYEINIGSINIKLFRTMHIPDSAKSWEDSFYSYGVIIDNCIMFSSDTRFDIDLINWVTSSFNIKYIFHDCQFFPGGVHASYQELLTLPESIRAIMYLCHYGDNFKNFFPTKDGFAGFVRQGCYYII